jgi:pilus assembly protein CpaB
VARRILTIALAIVLAIVGTGAVLLYVKQADKRALAGQQAVTVLVATQQIPAGTPASTALADGMLARQQFPASSVPADAVRSLTPQLAPLVMSAAVPSGELLLRPMLVASVLSSSGLAIPAGMVAVTIPVCVPAAVAGYIYPQSQVAIFDTVFAGSAHGQTSCGSSASVSGSPARDRTRIVLPRVTVLAIGQAGSSPSGNATATGSVFGSGGSSSSSSSTDPSAQGSVLVTFAVSQADAERVITLTEAGVPYLALLSKSSVTGQDYPTLPLFPAYK